MNEFCQMEKNTKNKQEEMYQIILEWESSGISQEKFYQKHGIAKSTFGYWRKKYLADKKISKQKRNFIPIHVSSEESGKNAIGNIELSYPNGVRLICSSQIDLSRLKTLIIL
jgi:transposase-like protein